MSGPPGRRGVRLSHLLIAAVALVLLLMSAGTLRITVEHMRRFLGEQLATHAQDAATSLGLSMSARGAAGDVLMMQSMVDAVFDSGYFRAITVTALDGAVLVEKTAEVRVPSVPAWFVDLVPLDTPPGEAKVMSGWRQSATVRVRSHPGFAYAQLWGGAVTLLAWCASILVLATLGAVWLVHALLAPLRALERQARAVMARERPAPQPEPFVRELRGPVATMNLLAARVDRMLDGLSERIRQVARHARRDEVTGLGNARAFESALADLEERPEHHLFGVCALVQVPGIGRLNARDGFGQGDARIRAAAEVLEAHLAGALLARLGGGLFGAVMPDLTLELARERVAAALEALRGRDVESAGLAAGLAYQYPGRAGRGLQAAARDALARSLEGGGIAVDARDEQHAPVAAREIAALVAELEAALEHERLVLHWQPVRSADGREVLQHEALARLTREDGSLIPAIGFVALLGHAGLAEAFDRRVVARALAGARLRALAPGRLAVNLTAASAASETFHDWLDAALAADPQAARRLDVECGEHGVAAQPGRALDLARMLHRHGARFGVDHLGAAELGFGYMAALRVDYVKLDASLTAPVVEDAGAREIVADCVRAAAAAGLDLVALAVQAPAQRAVLEALNVPALQGNAIAEPRAVDAP